MEKRFTDQAAIGSVKRTKEGYLIARSKVARTGIQDYLASELGLAYSDLPKAQWIYGSDGKPKDAVARVDRPSNEVFDAKSLDSLTRAPVTIDHPPEFVDADNWAKYAVGEIGDRYKADMEDGWIAVDPMIKDAAAILKAETTHREWSMGYSAQIRPSELADADFEMYDIRFNHIAAVPRGRAGSQYRIGDASKWGVAPLTTEKGPEMEMKAVAIGDKAFNVKADDADALLKTVTDMQSALGELKAKLADAEAKILTDEQIKEKAKVIADGIAKREAVIAKFGDEAVKDASEAEIAGMYRVIGDVKDDTARKAIGDAKKESKGEMSELEKFYAEKEAKGKK